LQDKTYKAYITLLILIIKTMDTLILDAEDTIIVSLIL